ncbi:MAG: RNA polymerase sigma factor [Ktedonobacteraceae bacterium]
MLASHYDTVLLVKRAQAGDVESFAMLVQNHQHEICGYLTGLLGNREDGCDFTQQVFFKAWLNIGTLKNPVCFTAWLRQIARNLIYDYWRGRGKKVLYVSWEDLAENSTAESADGPEDSIAEAELVKLALAELPLKLRRCLLLEAVNGFSHDEIAERVGIGEASVGTYISSARKQFRIIYRRLQSEQEREVQPQERLTVYTLHYVGSETCRSLSR